MVGSMVGSSFVTHWRGIVEAPLSERGSSIPLEITARSGLGVPDDFLVIDAAHQQQPSTVQAAGGG